MLADIESQIMPHHSEPSCVLNDAQIRHFIDNGFIRIDEAFRRSLADDARSILWRDSAAIRTIRQHGRSR